MHHVDAIVTLAIGDGAADRWHRCAKPRWERYAARHGFDLVCIDTLVDPAGLTAERPLGWQKCLIATQPFASDYERLVLVDPEMLVNPDAPRVTLGVPPDCVGAADQRSWPNPDENHDIRDRLARLARAHGRVAPDPRAPDTGPGDTIRDDRIIAPGLLVVSPHHHGEALAAAYRDAATCPTTSVELAAMPLSRALRQRATIAWLDARFNVFWLYCKVARYPFLIADPWHPRARLAATSAHRDTYMLNFAGCPGEIELVDSSLAPRVSTKSVRSAAPAPALEHTPVALFLYHRPGTTAKIFEAIRAAQPRTLFVVADGPDPAREGDAAQCARTRDIVERVDWPCEVVTDFSPVHLGCKSRFETGMASIFRHVDRAIILEDDCLPHPSFFPYCEALLDRYRDDERVLTISGVNWQFGLRPTVGASYSFSRYALAWGWGTWRRAWDLYEPAMTFVPGPASDRWLDGILHDRNAVRYWSYIFATQQSHWDYAWTLSSWRHRGMSVVPGVNLVSNIGFDADGTYNKVFEIEMADLPTEAIELPLRHPEFAPPDPEADQFIEDVIFSGALRRLLRTVRERVRRHEPLPEIAHGR